MSYTPRTGRPCSCKRGVQRDNCPACEGTGQQIDFAAIHAARAERNKAPANLPVCPNCGQWQRPENAGDCFNECKRRGFTAPKIPRDNEAAHPIRLCTDALGEWPFPVMAANPDAWVEINEERYWYCLEVLPPLYFPGGFAISEANNHTATGQAVYACVVTIGKRHFARYLTLAQAQAEAPRLRAQVAP